MEERVHESVRRRTSGSLIIAVLHNIIRHSQKLYILTLELPCEGKIQTCDPGAGKWADGVLYWGRTNTDPYLVHITSKVRYDSCLISCTNQITYC